VEAAVNGDRIVYANLKRRVLLVASLLAALAISFSVILEPDPATGLRPLPGDYVWVVVPGVVMIAALAWRAWRVRVVTDQTGIDIVRVVGHELVPWTMVRSFEVHRTPARWGWAVVARRKDELVVRVTTELPVSRKPEANERAHERAAATAAKLEEDRRRRLEQSASPAVRPRAGG
jgi:hypothetical protein